MSGIGRVIAGRYELRDVLGRGGMATVYRAYQAALDRFVAIKLIDPRLADDGNFVERFRLEARIAASLRHPHILTIFDFGDDDGILYLATELIEGGTLQEQLDRFNSFAGIIDLIEPIGQALDFAHARGIVHRDVKPANIFLEGSRPILADFGIAKVLRDSTAVGLTATGAGIGTPEYMAPEQLLGQAIDGRADLYALATIVYRLLTGRLPYRLDGPDDTALALVMRKVNGSPPLPSSLNPAISPTLDAILLRALARDPSERYPHAGAFIAALRGALGLRQHPIPAQPTATTTPLPVVSARGATGAAGASTVQGDTFVPRTPQPQEPMPMPTPTRVPERRSTRPFLLGAVGALALLILVVAGGALALTRGGTSPPAPTNAAQPTATLPIVAAASATVPPSSPTPATTIAAAPTMTAAPPSATVPVTVAASPTALPPTPAPAAPTASASPRPSPTPTSRALPTPTPGTAVAATATTAPAPSTSPAPTAPPVATVRETVQSAVLSLPGTSSGVFIDLTNNANNYSDDPDRIFPAASLIKLPIAGAAYQRVAGGQWQLGDRITLAEADKVGGTGILREQPAGTTYTLDRLIEIMLLYSDNTAANMIVDRLGGFEQVNAFSRAQGMNNTIMRRKLYDLETQRRGIDNTTTSGDIARFFVRLNGGELIDGLTSDRLRTILVQRGRDDKAWTLRNLPTDTIALHMTGTGDGQRNDVILVTAGERQYLLVLMVSDSDVAGIEAALARVSATIYNAAVGR